MRILPAIAACVVLLAAPARADDLPAAKDGIVEPSVAAKMLPSGKDVVVEVLDAGAAPREELRYQLSPGEVDVVEAITKDRVISGGGSPVRRDKTEVERAVAIHLTKSGERAHVEIDVTGIKVAGQDQSASGSIKANVSAKGMLDTIHDDDGPADFQTSIVVLPDGAVGKGARWRLIRFTPDKTALHIDTYTVRSHAGHVLELDVSTVQLLVQSTQPTSDGSQATVQRYEYQGSGHLTIDTTALVATESEVTLHSTMVVALDGQVKTVESNGKTRTVAHAVK